MLNKRFFYVLAVILFFLTTTQTLSLSSVSLSSKSRVDLNKRNDNYWPNWSWASLSEGGYWPFTQNQHSDSYDSDESGHPAASSYLPTWWTWSSKDGYRSGKGNKPLNVHSNNPQGVRYGPKNNYTTHYDGHRIPTTSQEIQQWLYHHNRFRARYGAGPLKWSQKMVAASKRLTDTCVWQHTQNNPFGENMSAGQTSIQQVVEGWVTGPEEKDSYEGGNSEPSHFTQVVWLATTEVGCYRNTCRDVRGANLPQSPVSFWACNYNPPGNVIGQLAQNVKARPGGNPM